MTGVSSIFPSVCTESFLCKSFFTHHLLTQGVLLGSFLKVESWGHRNFPVTLIVSIAAIKRNFWNCAKVKTGSGEEGVNKEKVGIAF